MYLQWIEEKKRGRVVANASGSKPVSLESKMAWRKTPEGAEAEADELMGDTAT
jgi:hypothetical protein